MSETPALFIVHRTHPGQRDAARRIWEQHIQPLVAENPSHLRYFYCFDDHDPDVIRVFQQYTDGAAARAFLATAGYADYLRAVEPLLVGPPEVHSATLMWVKGLAS